MKISQRENETTAQSESRVAGVLAEIEDLFACDPEYKTYAIETVRNRMRWDSSFDSMAARALFHSMVSEEDARKHKLRQAASDALPEDDPLRSVLIELIDIRAEHDRKLNAESARRLASDVLTAAKRAGFYQPQKETHDYRSCPAYW